jgi:hypothetical protein
MAKQILVVGDPVAGFSFVGSFDDSEDAIRIIFSATRIGG